MSAASAPQTQARLPLGPITPQTPLPPAIQAWKVYLQDQGRSPNTIKAFVGDLNLLAHFLPPERTLGQITTRDLNRFLDWLQHGRGVPCSTKSLARRITSLKAFFRWLHQYGVLVQDPAEKVIQRSAVSPLPRVLTPAEVRALQERAQAHRQQGDARPAALLGLLLETGLKKSETLNLYLNHIVLEGPDAPAVYVRYAAPRYRHKERRIPVSQAWAQVFAEYQAQYHPHERAFPWSPRRLEYILENLGREAGLDKRVSFAMLRWTAALHDYRQGMDPDELRAKLGLSKMQWREVGLKLRRLDAITPQD